jgi:hypothetical protein
MLHKRPRCTTIKSGVRINLVGGVLGAAREEVRLKHRGKPRPNTDVAHRAFRIFQQAAAITATGRADLLATTAEAPAGISPTSSYRGTG